MQGQFVLSIDFLVARGSQNTTALVQLNRLNGHALDELLLLSQLTLSLSAPVWPVLRDFLQNFLVSHLGRKRFFTARLWLLHVKLC